MGGKNNKRIAACACGALKATVTGEPATVNACGCGACQRRSGSAFTYTAFFPNDAVTIEGAHKSFRQVREAGRWHESSFCPACGTWVFSKLEVLPPLTGVSVGCFADRDFPRPDKFYWSSQRHPWFSVGHGVEEVASQ